jgi:hypothetical protein
MHDKTRGTLRTLQKEDLQREITRPLELGSDDLLEDDKYLAEVNMEDLESISGERQESIILYATTPPSTLWPIKILFYSQGGGSE